MEALSHKHHWNWNQTVGLHRVMTDLGRVMSSGRLHPIVLLEGLEGIGKRHLAMWMSAQMTCLQLQERLPCGNCANCRGVMGGFHPDVAVLNPESETIKTADVETLQEHFMMMSSEGLRIGVIMNADRMTIEASNRLLKTLEEPPEQVRVILTSSRPLLIPATVLGRCLRWRVKPPEKELVTDWFKSLLHQSGRAAIDDDSVNHWVLRLRHSPGLLKRELDDSTDHYSGISGDVAQLLAAQNPVDVTRSAANLARVHKAKVPDILSAVEWELNKIYRARLKSCSMAFGNLSENGRRAAQRRLLHDIRMQAVLGKVTLNAQLVAESIGLSEWRRD